MLSAFLQNRYLRHFSHPSILFCLGNIFVFTEQPGGASLSSPAAIIALITFTLVFLHRFLELSQYSIHLKKAVWLNPMSILAAGALLSGFFAAHSGAWLPAGAGLFFAIGNFLNAFPFFQRLQNNDAASGMTKAFTHAAVYYGLGYACIGLMAGGFETWPSALTTTLGIGVTTLATFGLALGKFTSPAAPFIAVAVGTGINTVSGIITGNIFGALNNLCAMLGECGLAYLFHKGAPQAPKPEEKTGLWAVISAALTKPAAFLVKKLALPTK